MNNILIGFEKDSAKPVYMEHHHANVSGQTQKSGKTTTIKALIARSGMKAIVFITKRGEIGFKGFNKVQPYYKEPKKGNLIDWQYVESILEATMGERMKLERSFIIRTCKGAKSLQEVYENIKIAREKTRKGFDESVYINLSAYFEIVLPQIKNRDYATSITLESGVNVMNLIGMTIEMQSLVIQATLDYLMQEIRGVIAVIPEAWKFIPKSKNPVKIAAESYIRQGAGLKNYLWLDSQDLAGVDTSILKQCNNWLMGFQRELNEATRVSKTAGKKVTVEMIQSLPLGHFVVSIGVRQPKIVYVWPDGVPKDMAVSVAKGDIAPEVVKDYLEKLHSNDQEEEEDMVYKEKYEETVRELEETQARVKRLIDSQDKMVPKEEHDELLKKSEIQEAEIKEWEKATEEQYRLREQAEKQLKEKGDDALKSAIKSIVKDVLKESAPKLQTSDKAYDIQTTDLKPTVTVEVQRYQVDVGGDSVEANILRLWRKGEIPTNVQFSLSLIREQFDTYGWKYSNVQGGEAMKKLLEWGFIETCPAGARKDYKFIIQPNEAQEQGTVNFTEKTEQVIA